MPNRLGVFIDYQNVYRRARGAFANQGDSHMVGQVDPAKIGHLLAGRTSSVSTLELVRIYRGLPDGAKDSKGNAACTRQVTAWSKLPKVEVFTRPLRYTPTHPMEKPSEKGIDVQLAIDFVVSALDGRFDIGIVFSADTDLKPAIETVLARTTVDVHVATWQPPQGYASRIQIAGKKIWCHYLHRTVRRATHQRSWRARVCSQLDSLPFSVAHRDGAVLRPDVPFDVARWRPGPAA